ncbi:hypothetical protein HK097_007971 [Rhizophlyctis rosea]|uniref:Tubulin-specific chaperone A n=1 Tax=Rhizophlyctis rosea TaxID=64517 RepID=A0AAD5X9D7_9FUNG|nr:hypothetical protein HK097_007971 [Rhizophlyctis rosea]
MLTNPGKTSLRDLKIKTGVVRRKSLIGCFFVDLSRIAKELSSYQKEAEKQQARIDKLIAEGADDADVRKQREVLEETNLMFPDTKRRLAAAHKELVDLVAGVSAGDESITASEELAAAQQVLAEVTV